MQNQYANLSAIAIALLLCGLTACHPFSRQTPDLQPDDYFPQAGDLLFNVADASAFAAAITDATAQRDSLKFSHVAIVAVSGDGADSPSGISAGTRPDTDASPIAASPGTPYVIEASSRHGVARTTWTEYLANAPKINGKPAIVVMRVIVPDFPLTDAVSRAASHIGEGYDWSFLPDNGRLYCSELVYESYRWPNGAPLFPARPMNFRDADGNMPAFWTELFEKLGEPIPEGVPGTNPSDLAKEPVLQEVWRFF